MAVISRFAGLTFSNWQSDVTCSVRTLTYRAADLNVDESEENIQHHCRVSTPADTAWTASTSGTPTVTCCRRRFRDHCQSCR
jgi:hypothetical protein